MTTPLLHLDAAWTVNEVLTRYPATAGVFHRHALDSCCGAHLTLTDAAARADTDLAGLLAALETSARESAPPAGRR